MIKSAWTPTVQGPAGANRLDLSVDSPVTVSELGESVAAQLTRLKNPNFADGFRHGGYKEALELANELAVHMDYGKKPESILKRKRPNEPKNILDYRINSWEHVTWSILNKPTSFIQRMFNRETFKLSISAVESASIPAGQGIVKYLTEQLPVFGDFENNFLRSHLLLKLLADANSYLAIIPAKPQFNRDGTQNTTEQELPNPYPFIIPSSHIIGPQDQFLFVESDTKSPLIDAQGKVVKVDGEYTGKTFFLFTRDATFEIFQIGQQNDRRFSFRIWHEHYLGQLPATKFRGILLSRKEKVEVGINHSIHASFYQPAVPFLNEYVDSYGDYKLSLRMNLFLQKYEAKRGCPTCGGNGKIPSAKLQGGGWQTCTTCNGDVNYHDKTPANTIVVAPNPQTGKIDPPAAYIKLPVEVVEEMRKEVDRLEEKILGALNFEFLLRRNLPAGTSAAALVQDKTPANASLERIRSELVRLGNFSLRFINLMRYGTVLGGRIDDQKAEIQTADRFDISTVNDLITQYERLVKIEAPEAIVRAEFVDLIEKRWGSGSVDVKKIKARINIDTLWHLKEEQVNDTQLTMEGLITPMDRVIHYHIDELIDLACEANPGFLELSRSEQKEIITQLAEQNFEIPQNESQNQISQKSEPLV